MSQQMLTNIMFIAGGLFAVIAIAYFIIMKKTRTKEMKQLQQLRQGTKEKTFSADIIYQRLYLIFIKIPFIKKYLLKIRFEL